MNRFLAWLICAAALFTMLPGTADARWVTQRLAFRTADVNRVGGFAPDTAYASMGAGQKYDTTAAVSTDLWELPRIESPQTAAGDSVDYAIVWLAPTAVQPTGAVSIAADTAYFIFQVSGNGQTWQNVTATENNDPVNYTLEQGTTNSFYRVIEQHVGGVASGGIPTGQEISTSTAPTDMSIWGVYPLFRLVVSGDYTGQYEAFVRFWTNDPGDPRGSGGSGGDW